MKKSLLVLVMFAMLSATGCQSTLDRESASLNDTMMQRVTRENDQHNIDDLERGEITSTTKAIKDERNHKARRLARSMARDVDKEYPLPAIPTNMDEEPVWVDPDAAPTDAE